MNRTSALLGFALLAQIVPANATNVENVICGGTVEQADRALANGMNPNMLIADGWAKGHTPLTLALNYFDCKWPPSFEIALLLIERGADVNGRATIYGGTTPLLEAVRSLHLQAVELLLKEGADANAADSVGRTALMSFSDDASETPLKIVEVLLKTGADPRATSKTGLTAEKWALELRRPDIAEVIRKASR